MVQSSPQWEKLGPMNCAKYVCRQNHEYAQLLRVTVKCMLEHASAVSSGNPCGHLPFLDMAGVHHAYNEDKQHCIKDPSIFVWLPCQPS